MNGASSGGGGGAGAGGDGPLVYQRWKGNNVSANVPLLLFFSTSLSLSLPLASWVYVWICAFLRWCTRIDLFFFFLGTRILLSYGSARIILLSSVLLIATYSDVYLVTFVLGNVDCRTCMVSLVVRRTRNMST